MYVYLRRRARTVAVRSSVAYDVVSYEVLAGLSIANGRRGREVLRRCFAGRMTLERGLETAGVNVAVWA